MWHPTAVWTGDIGMVLRNGHLLLQNHKIQKLNSLLNQKNELGRCRNHIHMDGCTTGKLAYVDVWHSTEPPLPNLCSPSGRHRVLHLTNTSRECPRHSPSLSFPVVMEGSCCDLLGCQLVSFRHASLCWRYIYMQYTQVVLWSSSLWRLGSRGGPRICEMGIRNFQP
jgi:hypothetical protein